MKKQLQQTVIIFFIATCLTFQANGQTAVVDLNFDGYNGTVQTVPAGYYFSWNNTTSNSFYTSAGNFGVSAPSYKFGNDGDFIVTPVVNSADSLTFWSKGNGSPFSPLNELRIYHSVDSISWILDATIVPLSASSGSTSIPLNQVSGYFKIEYFKSTAGGNLAFDDLKIYNNVPIGLSNAAKDIDITVYPTPTTGQLNIRLPISATFTPLVEVFDMLGNNVRGVNVERKGRGLFSIDLSGKSKGFYFVRIKSGDTLVTKRITIVD